MAFNKLVFYTGIKTYRGYNMQPLLLGCFRTVGFVCLLWFIKVFWWEAKNKASKALTLQYKCFISRNRSQTCICFCTFCTNF